MRRKLLPALLALALGGCATLSVKKVAEKHPPRIVFTTAIEEDQPVDEITALAEHQDRLCLSGRWFDLPHTTLGYRYELKDGGGQVLYVGEQEVTASAATWFTYSCYGRTKADAPGTWSYTLTLGDFEQAGQIEVAPLKPKPLSAIIGVLKEKKGEVIDALGGLMEAARPNTEPVTDTPEDQEEEITE
ncbi:MAG: hypothetical protein P1V51_17750 [Deltaproteobacteria bacterium]|nr:hypothetical protein [Deltaproteobacteria bacterium]